MYSFGVLAFEIASGGLLPLHTMSDEAVIGFFTSGQPVYPVLFTDLSFEGKLASIQLLVRQSLIVAFIDRPSFADLVRQLSALF